MRGLGRVWQQKVRIWLPALLFFLLNLGAWAYYQAGDFGDQVSLLEKRLEDRQKSIRTLSAEEHRLRELEEKALDNRRRVEILYTERLSTQRARLTDVIREVRELARGAGLEPTSTTYPETEFEEYDLERKGFVFSVSGSYANLRRFINTLELTESFITINSIGLAPEGERSGSRLRISFRISTLFAAEEGMEELMEQQAFADSPEAEGGAP